MSWCSGFFAISILVVHQLASPKQCSIMGLLGAMAEV